MLNMFVGATGVVPPRYVDPSRLLVEVPIGHAIELLISTGMSAVRLRCLEDV